MIEKILQENPNRFTLLPIQYPEIWKLYKEMQATVWFVEELSFSDDLKDWAKMTESEKHFVKMILAFFASADAIVNENICQNFATEIQIPEARAVYSFQIMMEQVHSETYALLIDSYIKDPIEKDKLFRDADMSNKFRIFLLFRFGDLLVDADLVSGIDMVF